MRSCREECIRSASDHLRRQNGAAGTSRSLNCFMFPQKVHIQKQISGLRDLCDPEEEQQTRHTTKISEKTPLLKFDVQFNSIVFI